MRQTRIACVKCSKKKWRKFMIWINKHYLMKHRTLNIERAGFYKCVFHIWYSFTFSLKLKAEEGKQGRVKVWRRQRRCPTASAATARRMRISNAALKECPLSILRPKGLNTREPCQPD